MQSVGKFIIGYWPEPNLEENVFFGIKTFEVSFSVYFGQYNCLNYKL